MSQPTCDEIGHAIVKWLRKAPKEDAKVFCEAIGPCRQSTGPGGPGPGPGGPGLFFPDQNCECYKGGITRNGITTLYDCCQAPEGCRCNFIQSFQNPGVGDSTCPQILINCP